jgi:hypothetical protein
MTSTETKWRARVTEWRGSGQTPERFAEGKDFKSSTLVWWASHLRRASQRAVPTREDARPATPVPMARVIRRTTPAPSESGVTIALGAARIMVTRGFDRDLLRQVVDTLGGEL